jgi:hypothetical protein
MGKGSKSSSSTKRSKDEVHPYRNISAAALISSLSSSAPFVGSLPHVRKGIRAAVRSLKRKVLAVVGSLDQEIVGAELDELYAACVDASEASIRVIARIVKHIKDLNEYSIFSAVALPEQKGRAPKGVWTNNISESLHEHFAAMEGMKVTLRSAPKYRRRGADYCEGMLVGMCRALYRPISGGFSKAIAGKLSWTPYVVQAMRVPRKAPEEEHTVH